MGVRRPTKRQDVAVEVLRQPIGIAWMAVRKQSIRRPAREDVSDHLRLW